MNTQHLKSAIPLGLLGLAGTVTLGVVTMTGASAAAASGSDDDAYVKREDSATSLVLVADDDDDDDGTGTGTRTRTGGVDTTAGTGSSISRADGTSSRYTAVSRDRDISRGDLTKDWTRDGGDRTRDLTPNLTNDHSRHDTRG